MGHLLKHFSQWFKAAFALFLLIGGIKIAAYHWALVTFPFSNTLREGAMMTNTSALLKGLNPYSMSLQPEYMNCYGIIYPLLVCPWAKLFGVTILVHRIVTAFFILASCILVLTVLRRMAVPLLLNLWAVLMLYSSLTYPGTSTPTIDPGAPGMFFFLLTVFVPWFRGYSYKSLMASMLFGVLSFYTKPYAFLGAIIICSYMFFFVSKKKSVFYGGLLLMLSVLSVIFINKVFPAYFDNCFFSSLNMATAWSSTGRLYLQISEYSQLHLSTLILLAAFVCWYGWRAYKNKTFNKTLKSLEPVQLAVYAGIGSAFVLYTSLGRHSGAMLWYFFQLLSPFLLIAAAWVFSRNVYWPLLCLPFLALNLLTMSVDQNYKYFDKNFSSWPDMATLVSQYQNILNSPAIAPLLVEQDKKVYDNGQSEYFISGAKRKGLMGKIFKEDVRVYVQGVIYFSSIRNMVHSKEFDLIILQPHLMPMGIGDEINKNYKCEGELMLYSPQDRKEYAVTIWKPL